jgi:ubiquinone/menaquinone biosynthesis C-methylase UbiE
MTHGHTRGQLVHSARAYDLLVWLLLLGRESAFREKLVRLARVKPGNSVLDIGCGTGSQAIAVKRQVGANGSVHGIDASPEMIARARQKAARARLDVAFSEGSVETLPFPDHQFDVVLSIMMLHHLPRSLRPVCAREVQRVLKPGGHVMAVDFGRPTDGGRKGLIAHFHQHAGLDVQVISELLGNAGLRVTESGATGVPGVNYVLAGA